MAELKTKPTKVSIDKFLKSVDEKKRDDSYKIIDMMKKITKKEPVMWGSTMIGFGNYHYKYKSGHEGDCFMIGFAPRKAQLVIYMMPGYEEKTVLMKKLGKYKTGKSCLYINKLEDVDVKVLKELMKESYNDVKKLSKSSRSFDSW
ncbi:MAG: DUF1801 domain-containing protein [Ignavibacteriae bacterium]|nr:MAG: DUF1801 domain-containing protein [Ignavibacteriota bacterium]